VPNDFGINQEWKGRAVREMIQIKLIKAVLMCVLLYSITPLNADIPWLHVDGNKIKDPEGNVVVLRGIALPDLSDLEVGQGGAINMIDRITDKNDSQGSSPGWYQKVLRIQITPPDSVDNWPYPFAPDDDSLYNELLRPVVYYCADKDLYAIIALAYFTDTWRKFAQTSEFWRYMAPRFANDPRVLFDLFDEPVNRIGSDRDNWLSVRTATCSGIRATSYKSREPKWFTFFLTNQVFFCTVFFNC